jgi:hypothetical protein
MLTLRTTTTNIFPSGQQIVSCCSMCMQMVAICIAQLHNAFESGSEASNQASYRYESNKSAEASIIVQPGSP